MTVLRIFTDEDIHGGLAPALRAANVDAVSTPELGRLAQLDEAQLEWATSQGRALVSFNLGHYLALHSEWLQSGKSHAGPILSAQRPLGDVLKRLVHLATTLDGEAMKDRLEFLSDW